MLVFAVITEALPVVGEKHDQRLFIDVETPKLIEEIADHIVGRRHLAVVRRWVTRSVLGRGFVGGVGLEDVKEEEEGPVRDRSKPGSYGIQRLRARPLDRLNDPYRPDPERSRCRPEEIEAGPDARRPAEDEGGDPRAGGVARLLQGLLQQRRPFVVSTV